jgi:hypothetical protein
MTTHISDSESDADADSPADTLDAEAVLDELIAHLAHRIATASVIDPPGARELAAATGRIAVPSHRRGYQHGVEMAAEGALDHVVEAHGYCDWAEVANLHAREYTPASDRDADAQGDDDGAVDDTPPVRADGGAVEKPRSGRPGVGGAALVAEYVAERGGAVAHGEVVRHLLLERGRDPEKADAAIHGALADGLIRETAPNRYHRTHTPDS